MSDDLFEELSRQELKKYIKYGRYGPPLGALPPVTYRVAHSPSRVGDAPQGWDPRAAADVQDTPSQERPNTPTPVAPTTPPLCPVPPPCPPAGQEGGEEAEGRDPPRVARKKKQATTYPSLPQLAITYNVVHEVGPSHTPGSHSFVGWGEGGNLFGKGECGSPILEEGQIVVG
jgi:hypothetical protein